MMSNTLFDPRDLSGGLEKSAVILAQEDRQLVKQIKSFQYVTRNIPGKSSEKKDFEVEFMGCTCLDSCKDDCTCVQRFGPVYTQERTLVTLDQQMPVYECNSSCSCPSHCPHRVVQYGLRVGVIVFKTTNKGFGLKAANDIEPNTFVCEYAGEVISKTEAKLRSQRQGSEDDNYIITLLEHLSDGQTVTTCIDAGPFGNAARFINHSCDPNLIMIPVRVDNPVPKLALFTKKRISANEEFTFDYSGWGSNFSNLPQTEQYEIIEHSQGKSRKYKVCYCESTNCKKTMPFDSSLF